MNQVPKEKNMNKEQSYVPKIFLPEINKEAWELVAESYSLGDIAEFVGNSRLCNLGIHLNFKPFMTINSIFQRYSKI